VKKLTAPFKDRIRLGSPVIRVERGSAGREGLLAKDGPPETFDKVIFASHADQTLRMIADPTALERNSCSAASTTSPTRHAAHRRTLHAENEALLGLVELPHEGPRRMAASSRARITG
jgi:predicted NAD/FAD-binding protein